MNNLFNNNSSFWSDSLFLNDDVDILTGEKVENKEAELLKLAGYRRAIANFVSIVTGRSIPVKFNNKDESFTDGQQVVISGKIKDGDFDPTVGLALHEGSHCLLTDFEMIPKINKILLEDEKLLIEIANKYFGLEGILKEDVAESLKASNIEFAETKAATYIKNITQNLLNIVEDRRIDNYVFKSAPGYKGYYTALYDKYFHAKVVDKGLQAGDYRDLDWNSYMFRIINITNVNRDLNALPGLKDIWNLLDLRNIDRLESTTDAFKVALGIFEIVENNLPTPEECEGGDGNEGEEGEPIEGEDGSTNGGDPIKAKTPEGDAPEDDGSKAKGSDPEKGLGEGNFNANQPDPLSDRQRKMLDKQIEKQTDFLNNNIQKSKLTKADAKKMNTLEKSGAELKSCGQGVDSGYWNRKQQATSVLVIKNLTSELMDEGCFGFADGWRRYKEMESRGGEIPIWFKNEENETAVNKGLVLGKLLGKKLQVRGDVNTTKFTRLEAGKIDKRLIASLGFGAERIFQQTFIDQYNPAYLHLSIDASGSMHGDKWRNSMTAAVAIAQAASMTQNVEVAISIRGSIGSRGDTPCIVVVYDSTKDKMTKIRSNMKWFYPCGLTPEGLCFEAIQNLIQDGSKNVDSYFLNFSDGAPYWSGGVGKNNYYYSGTPANIHTRTQVDKMRDRGIKVISYFIDNYHDTINSNFKACYGKDAKKIDTSNVSQLAKTMNDKFLEKVNGQ